jgi:hypothetical protein
MPPPPRTCQRQEPAAPNRDDPAGAAVMRDASEGAAPARAALAPPSPGAPSSSAPASMNVGSNANAHHSRRSRSDSISCESAARESTCSRPIVPALDAVPIARSASMSDPCAAAVMSSAPQQACECANMVSVRCMARRYRSVASLTAAKNRAAVRSLRHDRTAACATCHTGCEEVCLPHGILPGNRWSTDRRNCRKKCSVIAKA